MSTAMSETHNMTFAELTGELKLYSHVQIRLSFFYHQKVLEFFLVLHGIIQTGKS